MLLVSELLSWKINQYSTALCYNTRIPLWIINISNQVPWGFIAVQWCNADIFAFSTDEQHVAGANAADAAVGQFLSVRHAAATAAVQRWLQQFVAKRQPRPLEPATRPPARWQWQQPLRAWAAAPERRPQKRLLPARWPRRRPKSRLSTWPTQRVQRQALEAILTIQSGGSLLKCC